MLRWAWFSHFNTTVVELHFTSCTTAEAGHLPGSKGAQIRSSSITSAPCYLVYDLMWEHCPSNSNQDGSMELSESFQQNKWWHKVNLVTVWSGQCCPQVLHKCLVWSLLQNRQSQIFQHTFRMTASGSINVLPVAGISVLTSTSALSEDFICRSLVSAPPHGIL